MTARVLVVLRKAGNATIVSICHTEHLSVSPLRDIFQFESFRVSCLSQVAAFRWFRAGYESPGAFSSTDDALLLLPCERCRHRPECGKESRISSRENTFFEEKAKQLKKISPACKVNKKLVMHYFLPFPKVDQRKRIVDSTLDNNSWAMQPQQGNNTSVFIQIESRKRKSAKVTLCIFKAMFF